MPPAARIGNSTLVSLRPDRERAAPAVKLLVLAQTPPPLHGQSVMVRALLEGLAPKPGFAVHHVNFRLSRDAADIGRFRLGKIGLTLGFALRAIGANFRHGCDALYYVPAPPNKRSALYRDWLVMLLCRPFFRRLVLHWHAVGLGEWLQSSASAFERTVTRWLLGRADLAIVLAESLRQDAEFLRARRIAVVANGVADPGPPPPRGRRPDRWQALFLGLCSEEKGLFAAAAAILEANRRAGAVRFTLAVAGSFPDEATAKRFRTLADANPDVIAHHGTVTGAEKDALFAASDCLLCPTHYAAEGQPLVVLEALARDLPIVATRWRALPETVPASCGSLVPPGDIAALAEALWVLQKTPPPPSVCREHYEIHFRLSPHIERLAAALNALDEARVTRA